MNRSFAVIALAFWAGSWSPAPVNAQISPSDLLRLGTGILLQVPNPQQGPPVSAQPAQTSQSEQRAEISEIQSRLNQLGYAAGPVDGEMGRRTRQAIAAFQRSVGHTVTGEPSESLLAALRSANSPALPTTAVGPSFDCTRATTTAEGAVCASPELSALDRQLSLAYDNAVQTVGTPLQLRTAQLQWIASRDACGADVGCLSEVYRSGLQALGVEQVAEGTVRQKPAGADTFTLLTGYDLPFDDYRSGTTDPRLKGISLAACQQQCELDDRCRAFTYNANVSVCILKDGVPTHVPFAGAVSGIKASSGAPADLARTTPTSPARNELPAPASVVMPTGIRTIAPVMSGQRLLTGFPIIHGPFNAEQIDIGRRHYIRSSFDLALFVDLLILNQFPDVLNDNGVADEYAQRFLTEDLLDQYFAGCRSSCDRNVPHDGWQGSNEFEREAAFRAFVTEIGPKLAAAGPSEEIGVLNITEVDILPYDGKAEAFPLKVRRPPLGLMGSVQPVVRLGLTHVGEPPTRLHLPRDRAESFVSRFPPNQRRAYLGLYQTLSTAEWDGQSNRPILTLTQTAAHLYADPLGQELLHDFAETEASAGQQNESPPADASDAEKIAVIAAALGFQTRDRRLIVRGADSFPSLIPSETSNSLGHLAAAMLIAHAPDILNDNDTAFAYLQFLPEPTRSDIVRSAGMDPAAINLTRKSYWQGLDEFARRALLVEIRDRAPSALSAQAPPIPLPIFAVCRIGFREYNFDRELFEVYPVPKDGCASIPISVGGYGDLSIGSVNIEAPLSTEQLPAVVSVPISEAQEYRRNNLNTRTESLNQSATAYAVEARITGIREIASGRSRQFELVVENERVLLFRPDDFSVPFERLELNPMPSVETVSTAPTEGLTLADAESINLLLLERQSIEDAEAHFREWVKARATAEVVDRRGGWAPFFHPDTVRSLSRGERDPEPTLLANFAEWTRQRASALPLQLSYEARSATLERLTERDAPGVIKPFSPGGTSSADRVAKAAARAGVPENMATALVYAWLDGGPELVGLGETDIVLVLPEPADSYTVPIDPEYESDGQFLDVIVDVGIADVAIERPEGRRPIVLVGVVPVGARIFASNGTEVASATFHAPSDTSKPPLAAAQQEIRDEQAALAALKQAEQSKQAEAERSQQLRIAEADIAGVRIGMSIAEAERLIRSEMDVAWVGVLAPTDPNEFGTPDPNAPLGEFRTFTSADGLQQFVIFEHPDRSANVLGVARLIVFPQPIDEAILIGQLKEKYGEPIEAESLVWTAHPGDASGRQGAGVGTVFRTGPCHASLRGAWTARNLTMLEAPASEEDADIDNIDSPVPKIDVSGGRSEGPRNDRSYYDPVAWQTCGPTVLATVGGYRDGTMLAYAILDLSAYANFYLPAQPAQAAVPIIPKL